MSSAPDPDREFDPEKAASANPATGSHGAASLVTISAARCVTSCSRVSFCEVRFAKSIWEPIKKTATQPHTLHATLSDA
ncbi:hypothetical protein, partial [Mycobacterium marinum]|uniref:hypothetical protein n=1 Tax=Mycobacterium marinum TaxID=1781 RepID=UPI00356908B4